MTAEWKGNPSADLARSERRMAWIVVTTAVVLNAGLVGWFLWEWTR